MNKLALARPTWVEIDLDVVYAPTLGQKKAVPLTG